MVSSTNDTVQLSSLQNSCSAGHKYFVEVLVEIFWLEVPWLG